MFDQTYGIYLLDFIFSVEPLGRLITHHERRTILRPSFSVIVNPRRGNMSDRVLVA
jgi:hypothetical protein